jgi:hypothetical protein
MRLWDALYWLLEMSIDGCSVNDFKHDVDPPMAHWLMIANDARISQRKIINVDGRGKDENEKRPIFMSLGDERCA